MTNKEEKERKSFLECMFSDLDDLSEGTDEEVKEELEESGIDVNGAEKRFKDLLTLLKNKYQLSCREKGKGG
jgi:hypothetical protein